MKMFTKKDEHQLVDSDVDRLKDAYEKLLLKVLCSLCHDKTKKVVSVDCGHHFCRPCILKHLGKSAKCPQCETAITKDTIITNKAITVFFEQLQQILTQCERHLPNEVVQEIKKKHIDESNEVPTPRRRSVRSSISGAEIAGTLKINASNKSVTVSPSTGLFETVQQNEKNKKLVAPHFKTPTRLPPQLPTGSAGMSEVSVDPEEKVTTWLKKAVPGSKAPTQERPINSISLVTQTTLVSASQAGAKKTPNLQRRSTPRKAVGEFPVEASLPDVEVSQADSIFVAKRPERKSSASTVVNRRVESEIVVDNDSELFQYQLDGNQQHTVEKSTKKLNEKLDSSFEKKGVKGIGLRRRRPTPVVTEPEPERISSDSETDDIAPRKKKTVCIISDEEADDEPPVDNPPGQVEMMETTISDFVDNREKNKSSKQYTNKKQDAQLQNNSIVKEVIPRHDTSLPNFPVSSMISEKRSRLSLRASSKTPSIVEVISPVSSPSARDKGRQEESRLNVNATVISRFKEMKSNFKEMKKKPLNVSTSSAPNVISTGRGKRSSISSKEMIIDSASGKNSPASLATKDGLVRETLEEELESAETLVEEVEESPTQCSPNIVENSLPVECSPKPIQTVHQHHLNTPTSTSPSVISNSPLQSPFVLTAPAVIISPSTVRLLEKGAAKSNDINDECKKRKTFSLESNTGEITGAGISAQRLEQAPNQRRHLSLLSPNPKVLRSVNRIHFFKHGKLNRARKPFKVVFVKLGYLSPKLVEKHLTMRTKRYSDAAVQTHLLYSSQSASEMISRSRSATSGIKAHNHSVLCQTSPLLDETTISDNHENSLTLINERRSKRGNSVLVSQINDVEEEEVIEKSQDLVPDHIFEEPAEKYQKKTVQETCTFDSNEIIPASYMTPTQKSRRQIKDTSSLSMSPATGPYETMESLNESDYHENDLRPVKETRRRKVARKLSEVEKDNSESCRIATESKKQKLVTMDNELEREMLWTYSSQDAVVVAAVKERCANAQVDTEPAASVLGGQPGNKSVSHISPFLEDTDTVTENTDVLNKTCHQNKQLPENLQKKPDEMEIAEKMVCEESDDEMIEGTPKSKADQTTPLAPNISLSFSSLARNQINQVHTFCSKFQHSSVNTSVGPGVTHLIVPRSDDMITNSTLKFYLAVARGLWVVSSQWIVDSISAGKVIPETPYEMKNMHGSDGPKMARLSGGGILKDFEFYCLEGDYASVNKEQLKDIIVFGGGGVILDLDQVQHKKYRIIISPIDTVNEEIFEKNCIVLIVDWVLESIENYKLASAFNYLPSGVTFTQISQARYDLPVEMLNINSG